MDYIGAITDRQPRIRSVISFSPDNVSSRRGEKQEGREREREGKNTELENARHSNVSRADVLPARNQVRRAPIEQPGCTCGCTMHETPRVPPSPRVHKTLSHSARGGGERRRADLQPREPSETAYFLQRASYLDPGTWRPTRGVRRTLARSRALKIPAKENCQRRGAQITGLRLNCGEITRDLIFVDVGPRLVPVARTDTRSAGREAYLHV